jgi:hypothetical protein
MAGEITSERRATSNRNGGRDHPGIPGDFRRNPHAYAYQKGVPLVLALKRRGTTLIEVAVGEMPDPWKVILPPRVRCNR